MMLQSNFPILRRKINGHPLVYLDNASTTQKPKPVIEAILKFYLHYNANVHRAVYQLSQEASDLYEGARGRIQKFLNAKHRQEIIFTSGATEAINLVVWTWGHENIKRGDEILLTEMEHHSNLVPWQVLARKKGAGLKFIPVKNSSQPPLWKRGGVPSLLQREGKGELFRLNLSNLDRIITKKTKILSLTHISNVLGTINPLEKIIKAAQKKGAKVLVDGAQAGGHIKVDVQKLGCDFYVLSGHKMYGPTGVGVLYGKKELLDDMPPYQTGGHMIRSVEWKEAQWNDLPEKFEAGTAPIAEVIGLGAAVDFLQQIGMQKIQNHELRIMNYALAKLGAVSGRKIYGPRKTKDRIGVISFNIEGVHPHDLATLLDKKGIAIRTGHHCAMPLHKKLGVEATARVSLGIYNSKADIDKLIKGIRSAVKIFDPSLYPSPGLGRAGRGRTNGYG